MSLNTESRQTPFLSFGEGSLFRYCSLIGTRSAFTPALKTVQQSPPFSRRVTILAQSAIIAFVASYRLETYLLAACYLPIGSLASCKCVFIAPMPVALGGGYSNSHPAYYPSNFPPVYDPFGSYSALSGKGDCFCFSRLCRCCPCSL